MSEPMSPWDPARSSAVRPRRRRWPRRLVITLVLVLGPLLAIGALVDRFAVGAAQDRIAAQVGANLTSRGVESAPPQVSIDGFPFLTQVVAGRYPSVRIGLRDVTTDGGAAGRAPVAVPRLDLVANDVRAPLAALRSGQGTVVAGTVTGKALVGYAAVGDLANLPDLQLAEKDGRLLAELPVDIFGRKVTVVGTGRLEPGAGTIRIRFDELTVKGQQATPALRQALSSYARQMAIDVPMPATPFDLTVRSAEATPDGLLVTAEATEVALR
ncbi:DUF2993 domain-containing protein [Pilimelia columellifera]|uniref:DUF2993 domain-containing protein n=1 Tax=Pilimelia columellifera subsp. columellifera TaxID=706583 RepID=A0ABN3NFB7_9ACTN